VRGLAASAARREEIATCCAFARGSSLRSEHGRSGLSRCSETILTPCTYMHVVHSKYDPASGRVTLMKLLCCSLVQMDIYQIVDPADHTR
jgi:hypothetical protein